MSPSLLGMSVQAMCLGSHSPPFFFPLSYRHLLSFTMEVVTSSEVELLAGSISWEVEERHYTNPAGIRGLTNSGVSR